MAREGRAQPGLISLSFSPSKFACAVLYAMARRHRSSSGDLSSRLQYGRGSGKSGCTSIFAYLGPWASPDSVCVLFIKDMSWLVKKKPQYMPIPYDMCVRTSGLHVWRSKGTHRKQFYMCNFPSIGSIMRHISSAENDILLHRRAFLSDFQRGKKVRRYSW